MNPPSSSRIKVRPATEREGRKDYITIKDYGFWYGQKKALDPIATGKIEELIHELKEQFTIVIVTHSMQQAARVSDRTAFFYLGKQIEYDTTEKIFMNPSQAQTEAYISGRFG